MRTLTHLVVLHAIASCAPTRAAGPTAPAGAAIPLREARERPVATLAFLHMHIAFDPNTVQPIGAPGTVYPTLRVVDDWGVLEVTGGALVKDWKARVVPAPPSPAPRPPPGRGRAPPPPPGRRPQARHRPRRLPP